MKVAEKYERKLNELWKTFPQTKNKGELNEYHKKSARLDNDFKFALFEEYGVMDNIKAERAFQLAWEHGHSNGYNEVEIYFSDFVELIK